MKTIKFLKRSVILHTIYCVVCAISLACFYFDHHTIGTLHSIGILLSYLWVINPMGIICLIIGLSKFFKERKDEEARKIIGKKWLIFILMFVAVTCVYFVSACTLVGIIGGA